MCIFLVRTATDSLFVVGTGEIEGDAFAHSCAYCFIWGCVVAYGLRCARCTWMVLWLGVCGYVCQVCKEVLFRHSSCFEVGIRGLSM